MRLLARARNFLWLLWTAVRCECRSCRNCRAEHQHSRAWRQTGKVRVPTILWVPGAWSRDGRRRALAALDSLSVWQALNCLEADGEHVVELARLA